MDGELWLSMMWTSAKVADLNRDPRIQLHSIITGPQAATEVKVRGTARAEASRDVQQQYAAEAARQLGWRPVVGEFALFAIDVGDVTVIGYDTKTGAQYVARWPEGQEYLRPSTTPTSLGPPRPVRRMVSRMLRRTGQTASGARTGPGPRGRGGPAKGAASPGRGAGAGRRPRPCARPAQGAAQERDGDLGRARGQPRARRRSGTAISAVRAASPGRGAGAGRRPRPSARSRDWGRRTRAR